MDVFRRGIKICEARMGLVSNNKELVTRSEYFSDRVMQSLLTDYHKVEEIPWAEDLDAQIDVVDVPGTAPEITLGRSRALAVGDWSALEARASDRRYTLFGNLGFLFRYTIRILEEQHRIWSFHASAMADEKTGELWLIPGGAGAGKTVFLLAGLERGWRIFSTEMTHLRVSERGCEWFKGSLFDNVRIGTLLYDFPGVAARLGIRFPEVKDPWAHKIALDLGHVQTSTDTLTSPPLRIVSPKVESGRERAIVSPIEKREKLVKLLFDNATEKHGGSVLLYDCLPLTSLDTPGLSRERFEAMERLVATAEIRMARTTLCGARNCMEGLLDG
ncbi:MAG: hypothetical protein HY726_16070 [Candidatus Rokubacteria bacterium]|nr:hypothetical protein [Candidatus Rokubacteria bacterium]